MQRYALKLDLQCFAAQEKTETATPKKKQESRQKGQVAKTSELPGSFILFFSFMFLFLFGGFFKDGVVDLFSISLYEYMHWEVTTTSVMTILSQMTYHFLLLMTPIFIISVVLAIAGNYVQIGFLVATEPLKPKLQKLNPIEGAKNIFAMRAVIEFLKSVFKMIVIAFISYLTLWNEKENIMGLSHLPLEQILSYVGRITVLLGLQIALVLIFIAILDYMYQKYEHEKKLKMSKQEVKDEHKKSEGDPLIKSKIKEKQRQLAMRRMMQEVPSADVVVTNPTHYAIALKYKAEEMDAPLVLAKGKDYMALRIKELAKQHEIVTMENKPLARALYERVEIGQGIPGDLFQAVAEILAYVYKLKKHT